MESVVDSINTNKKIIQENLKEHSEEVMPEFLWLINPSKGILPLRKVKA